MQVKIESPTVDRKQTRDNLQRNPNQPSKTVDNVAVRGIIKVQPHYSSLDTVHPSRKCQLSEYQVDIVHSTWPLLAADLTATGTFIFLDIFDSEPEIKKLFYVFK